MADTATMNPPTPAIADLAGGDDKSMTGLVSSLANIDRQKLKTDTGIIAQSDAQQAKDKVQRDQAFAAEGVAASEIPKPWDADKEHKKWETNPIEGFGSMGGLFAMVASAFTKAPMENAINGMAGAINAIKDGNEANYQRAYDAFKTNAKLADQRFKTQHELYGDALGLSSVDMAASDAKLRNAAVKFGDQHVLMLADHGMVKEIYELQAARANAHEEMMKAADALTEHKMRGDVYDLMVKDIPQGLPPAIAAAHKLAAWNKAHDVKDTTTPEQAVAGRLINEHPQATGEELAQIFRDNGVQVGRQPERDRLMQERIYYEEQAIRDREGREPTAAESAKIRESAAAMGRAPTGTGPGGVTNMGKEQALAVEEEMKKDPKLSRVEAIEKVKRAASSPSGNRLDDLSSKIDQTDNIIRGSEKQLEFLHTFKGGAGLMGKIMRGEEIASNIVGAGTQSERVEFRRRVHELQEMVPRIITDSNGRPLKSAQDKVDDFVAGINAGDTGPNTIRAYEELIAEMQKRQADYRARRSGGFSPDAASSGAGAPSAPAPEKSGKDAPWLKDPVKGPAP